MRKRNVILVCIVLILTTIPLEVSSDDYEPLTSTFYVDQQYNASTPGWHTTRWDTIHEAVENASNGDTIYVNGDGDYYYENVYIDVSINVFGNYSDSKPFVNGTGTDKSTFEIVSDWVNVSDFSIRNDGDDWHGISIGKTLMILDDFYNITVSYCEIESVLGWGILNRGSYNTFIGNYVYDATQEGIEALGNYNLFDSNEVNSCQYGIDLYLADNNILMNNTFVDNTFHGIDVVSGSNDNYIYQNDFYNNNGGGIQARDNGANNIWNASYPLGGNYWDDFSSDDDYYGANQDIVGWDLIADNQYNLTGSGGGVDYYPWLVATDGSYAVGHSPTSTLSATSVEETTATFNGRLSMDATSVSFNYGQTSNYGTDTGATRPEYAFAGGGTTRKVYKYITSDMSKQDETTDYGTTINAIADDFDYLYVGGNGGWLDQYWKSNLTRKTYSVNNYGDYIKAIAEDSSYVYVGGETTNKVYKYRKSDMTKIAETASYGGAIYAIAEDDTYIYAGGGTTNKVYKYQKSNMAKVTETASYGGTIWAIAEDADYIYACGDITYKVYQYWKSNLTKKAETASYGNILYAIADDDTYIYAGGSTTNKVYQYWKSNLTKKGETSTYGNTIRAIALDTDYIYVGGAVTNKVYQYYKSNLTKKAETASYGGYIFSVVFSKGNDFYYDMSGLSPGTLYHFRANSTVESGTAYGDDDAFLTKPNSPAVLQAQTNGSNIIYLTWSKGTGANNTRIQRKVGSYPSSITDGVNVYNGTGVNYENTGLDESTDYYYRAWSYTEWTYNPTIHQWSDGYSSSFNTTDILLSIDNIFLIPDLNITYFNDYTATTDITNESALSSVILNISGINGDETPYWLYYVNGTGGNNVFSFNMTHQSGNLWNKTQIRPDFIYPTIYFAPHYITWYNTPQDMNLYRTSYHLFNYTNPFTMVGNMSFWIEANIVPQSLTNSNDVAVYVIGNGEDLTYFNSDWRTKPNTQLAGTISRNMPFDHIHTSNSSHYLIKLATNSNGTVGNNINISGQFWVVLYQDSTVASRRWNLKYHDGSIANNTNGWYVASRTGIVWNTPVYQSGVPDVHVHFARRNEKIDGVNLTVTAIDAENNSITNYENFYFGPLPNLPPNPSAFIYPENGTYSGTINISWYPATDPNNDPLTYTLDLLYGNGTFYQNLITDTSSTYYAWDSTAVADGNYDLRIFISDGTLFANFTLSGQYGGDNFTIFNEEPNTPPILSNENPLDNSGNIDVNPSIVNVTINDPDGNVFNWTIEGQYINDNSGLNNTNGSKSATLITPLPYNTNIIWYVNVSDGYNWTNATYNFTTRTQYQPTAPSNFTAIAINRTQINLSWTNQDDYTYIEWNPSSSWLIGTGTQIYNSTGTTYQHINLNYDTQYFYQAWSYNVTDNVYSLENSSDNDTTDANNPVSFGIPNPINGSLGQEISFVWSIFITDLEDDFNWTIENHNQSSFANNDTNGTKTLSLSGLAYNTTYTIWVNATDGYNWTRAWYTFTTRLENEPGSPINFTATAINLTQIDLSWEIGPNADKTHIVAKLGSYPNNRTDGTNIYNNTGTSYSHAGLNVSEHWYYRAWSFNITDNSWSQGYAQTDATTFGIPNVTTNMSTGVEETNATLHGFLISSENFESSGIFEYYNTGDTQNVFSGNPSTWLSQTFTPNSTHNISSVKLKLYRAQTPDTINVLIKATDGASKPTGAILTSGTTDGNTLTASSPGEWREIDLTAYQLTGGTKYAIIIYSSTIGGTDRIYWRTDPTPAYAGGTYVLSGDGGSSWTVNSGIDVMFEEYGFIGGCYVKFQYGTTLNYTTNTTIQTKLSEQHFSENINSLSSGQLYHFRAFADNTYAINYGLDEILLTKPLAPTNLSINNTGIGEQTLAWTHGTGYNRSVVRGKIGSYPTTPNSDVLIYNDTGNMVIRNNLSGDDWYYRVWEYASEEGLYQYSDEYASNHLIVFVNNPPNQPTNEYPLNNSDYVDIYTFMNVTVSDSDGNNMSVVFKWENGTTIATATNVTNNSVASIWLPDYLWIEHDTNYSWYVIVDDGINTTTSGIWSFHTSKAWELNIDRIVNYLDVSILVSHYGEPVVPPASEPWDIIEDGIVNYLDISSLVSHYGESY